MKKAVVIGGPTASGKSSLAVSLAERLNGVVINADSLQVYDDLPILTAQPDAAEQSRVPHRLYGMAHPNDGFTAQSWRAAALAEMERAAAAGLTPVIVGGTGFYINALLQGMSAIPAIPPSARAEAENILAAEGTAGLFARLRAADPAGAARLDAQNPQRLTRAYEVLLHTGKPISYWQAEPREGPPPGWQFLTLALIPERDVLHDACARRIGLMQAMGMLDEVAAFTARVDKGEVAADAPLTHACGYRPLAAHLRGETSLDAALELMLIDTRQYARRQSMWFRRQWQPDITSEKPDDARVMDAVDKFQKSGPA